MRNCDLSEKFQYFWGAQSHGQQDKFQHLVIFLLWYYLDHLIRPLRLNLSVLLSRLFLHSTREWFQSCQMGQGAGIP